ncbi:MAG: DUF3365 domain-containing protein [Burkholderiales bacterium]|nr:DUF3365 domain-containing protein [Burkholderiales bacterium]
MRSFVTFTVLAGFACAAVAQGNVVEAYTAEARAAAGSMMAALAGELKKEIASGGPASAIGVCKGLAPRIAADISHQHAWKVSRVSLKPRNPVLGPADAWEQQALIEFDRQAAAGAKPEALERAEIVEEPQGRYFRYAKALPVQSLCLNCHGTPDKIAPGVKDKLAAEYPNDRATGYAPGQIRGAISIKRPL